MRGDWLGGTGGAAVLVWIAGCGAAPSPPPASAEPVAASAPAAVRMVKEPLQTGKPCLTGEAACGGGVCDLIVKSECDAPATCDVLVASSCRSATTVSESRGKKRSTFAPKEESKLNVAALCVEGDVLRTQVSEIKCQ